MAHKRGLLSGEHFSVDGTLIRAWASHKSLRRKDGANDDGLHENWHGRRRSNDTHESATDLDVRLYRKSDAAWQNVNWPSTCTSPITTPTPSPSSGP
jgi:hypothetical protein